MVTVLLAVVFVLLIDQARSNANNPPNTLLGTVAIDPDDDINAVSPSPVWAVAEANGRYYIGGNFQEVGGESQPYLAAIEVATGRLDQTWRPSVTSNGSIEILTIAVSPDGSAVYVGGRFTAIDGTFRNRIAKLDPETGAVDQIFNPDADLAVEAIVASNDSVWVGGAFLNIGGAAQPRLAKLDAITGLVDPLWTSSADGNVLDLKLFGGDLYVAGNFSMVGGVANSFVVRADASSGLVDATWLPAASARVLEVEIKPDGTLIYSAGAGSLGAGGNALQAFDATTGIEVWKRVSDGDVQAIAATDSLVYGGTHGQFLFLIHNEDPNFPAGGYTDPPNNPNAVRREKFFALDALTGSIDPWDPQGDSVNGVWELEIGSSGLLSGGDFHSIVNPTGVPGVDDTIFTPHLAVFPNIGTVRAAPEALFTVDCAGTNCNVDASASSDDGVITSYSWDFGGQTASGVTASVTLPDETFHPITLRVMDDENNTTVTTNYAMVGGGGLPVEIVSATSTNQNGFPTFSYAIPPEGATGDIAVSILSINDATATVTAPAGWTFAQEVVTGELRSRVWYRRLESTDLGASVSFIASIPAKGDLSTFLVRGTHPTSPFVMQGLAESVNRVGHRAPALSFLGNAAVIHHWVDRTEGTTEFTPPGNEATLASSFGTGPAHISSTSSVEAQWFTDTSPISIAIAEHHSLRAVGWSIAFLPAERCNGLVPTIDLNVTAGAVGTPGDDVILGTPLGDVITGGGGDDVICGGEGNDTINGQAGNDTIFGGPGSDTIFGDGGNEGPFNDVVDGGEGDDMIFTFDRADTIVGGPGVDTMNGGLGDDHMNGNAGNDVMNGGAGVDTMFGDEDDDRVLGDNGNDVVDGGVGVDLVNGGADDDVVLGGAGDDLVFGFTGNDIAVDGGAGADFITGGEGDDVIELGLGGVLGSPDRAWGNGGNDTITAISGVNIINAGPGDDVILGGTGADTIFGDGALAQAGNDRLDGGAGLDSLFGLAGDDVITATDGELDTVYGQEGMDTCFVDGGLANPAETVVGGCENEIPVP